MARSVVRTWTALVPLLAVPLLLLTSGRELNAVLIIVVAAVLAAAVLAAVHHAEVVAHRVGEPFGSLLLAVAVTVIEVGLIVTLMLAGGPETASLARDTVFAAAMITCNGIAGASLLVGAWRYRLVSFNAEGSGAALATVATLATLTLVLPTFTTSAPGAEFSPAQLVFAALASLVLYAMFVATQTVGHRSFFQPIVPRPDEESRDEPRPSQQDPGGAGPHEAAPDGTASNDFGPDEEGDQPDQDEPPSTFTAWTSLALLLVSLVVVIGLAKVESPAIEAAVATAGFPQSSVGVAIALLVLLPETLAAVRAALRNRVQVSLNLAYGSAMASIGLTIPAIAVVSWVLDARLVLGLGATQMILLALTVAVGILTVVAGRATRLHGGVHLVILAAFLFLAVAP